MEEKPFASSYLSRSLWGQIHRPRLGDIVDSDIGLSYRLVSICFLAGRYDNLCQSWLYLPSQGLRIWLLLLKGVGSGGVTPTSYQHPIWLFPSWFMDISFKDDGTVGLLLSVSFMVRCKRTTIKSLWRMVETGREKKTQFYYVGSSLVDVSEVI